MTVAELLDVLRNLPPEYEVELLNHATRQITYIDEVKVFGPECCTEPDDRPVVVLHTETWASESE